jgi:hypothetical protein
MFDTTGIEDTIIASYDHLWVAALRLTEALDAVEAAITLRMLTLGELCELAEADGVGPSTSGALLALQDTTRGEIRRLQGQQTAIRRVSIAISPAFSTPA